VAAIGFRQLNLLHATAGHRIDTSVKLFENGTMDSDSQLECSALVRKIQLICVLIVLGCVILMSSVSFIDVTTVPPAASPLLLSGLWVAIIAATVCAGTLPMVINLRFSLQTLMLMVIGGASCVTMMIVENIVFKTIGALGLLVWLFIMVGALARNQTNEENPKT
jgi:hypothetical protein